MWAWARLKVMADMAAIKNPFKLSKSMYQTMQTKINNKYYLFLQNKQGTG